MAVRCDCACHNVLRAEYFEARQKDDWDTAILTPYDPVLNTNMTVDASNQFDAVFACDACINRHAIALSDKPFPPPYLPPTDWKPQADGEGEG